jgi:hypothetical protein
LNPHTLRYRNLSPVGVYRNSARCSEPAGSRSSSLPLATARYASWTIQRRFRTSDAEGHRTGIRGLDALLKPTAGTSAHAHGYSVAGTGVAELS